jgi:hypothetical protein
MWGLTAHTFPTSLCARGTPEIYLTPFLTVTEGNALLNIRVKNGLLGTGP